MKPPVKYFLNEIFMKYESLDSKLECYKQLSKRQSTCAQLLLEGKTIREIAAILSLPPRTVETYVENMKTKLSCNNRTALIMKLVKLFER